MAMEKLKNLSEKPENAGSINTWAKRMVDAKTDTQALNVITTGGVKNKKILAVQSRIAKNSHKNRYASMAFKTKGSQPRNLSQAIIENKRNKQTQSKK